LQHRYVLENVSNEKEKAREEQKIGTLHTCTIMVVPMLLYLPLPLVLALSKDY